MHEDEKPNEFLFCLAEYHKIITIAKIKLYFKYAFYKLVKLIQIYIRKKLTRNITKWQSLARYCLKTLNNRLNKREKIWVADTTSNKYVQNRMVYRIKESLYITLECINPFRIICRHLPHTFIKMDNA